MATKTLWAIEYYPIFCGDDKLVVKRGFCSITEADAYVRDVLNNNVDDLYIYEYDEKR